MILAITDDGTSLVAAKDGRLVILAITDDGTNFVAAKDGRFVIFAIMDRPHGYRTEMVLFRRDRVKRP
ncbi:MAG TPA: hypothetical protein VFI49_02900 [Rudaea sp.]|nr:hypothetical protein [Rudaea sp.]